MRTGEHLKIKRFGSHVLGVTLEGNSKNPEPEEFRVEFPGGDISVVRRTDGSYWAHIRVDKPGAGMFNPDTDTPASIVEARLDILGEHTSQVNVGDFNNPKLYHLAVRIARGESKPAADPVHGPYCTKRTKKGTVWVYCSLEKAHRSPCEFARCV